MNSFILYPVFRTQIKEPINCGYIISHALLLIENGWKICYSKTIRRRAAPMNQSPKRKYEEKWNSICWERSTGNDSTLELKYAEANNFSLVLCRPILCVCFFFLQNRQYKYYSTGFLSAVDLYENPYSCNIKEEVEDENKLQGKKRKYNKTGKYKKSLDPSKESAENNEASVSVRCFCD